MEMSDILTTVRGREVRVEDVVVQLKVNGIFRRTIYEIIENYVVDAKFENMDIKLEDEEYFRRREEKKAMLGLADPISQKTYMEMNGLTPENIEAYFRFLIRKDILKEVLFTEERLNNAFNDGKADFATVSLARIVTAQHGEAEQVMEKANGIKVDFADLARKHSVERNTKFAGGYLGEIRRGVLPQAVEKAVFAAMAGELLGPFEEAGLWTVYKVLAVNEAELTASVRNYLHDKIFKEWLRSEVNTVVA